MYYYWIQKCMYFFWHIFGRSNFCCIYSRWVNLLYHTMNGDKKWFILFFNRATSLFCLPIMVGAPLEPNFTHLFKSSLIISWFLLMFSSSIYNNPRYIQRGRPSLTKLAKTTRWHITDISVDSSIIISKNLKSRTLSNIFWTMDEMQNKISPQFFLSW